MWCFSSDDWVYVVSGFALAIRPRCGCAHGGEREEGKRETPELGGGRRWWFKGGFERELYLSPRIWKHVVQKGDATCGNGYDTLPMVNMVVDESCGIHVYTMDIQETVIILHS
ncbi:hypothetical protein L1987_05731 [Smallanthus sonchifolius]|uniref:Uncharacterized protein n=1 Tax=Smallanthus sonchifolius TaxID=185202 RepID=A0ACB9JW71_9ASTR|nr:hypothetical protein L1987_05731 [Smallanthus sonchifolius]